MSNIEEAIKKINKFNEYENTVVLTEEVLYEFQEAIETILKELEKKDKMIDILAVQLIGLAVWNDKKDDAIIFKNKEEVKQYFERKVEDESSKFKRTL